MKRKLKRVTQCGLCGISHEAAVILRFLWQHHKEAQLGLAQLAKVWGTQVPQGDLSPKTLPCTKEHREM